MKFKKTLMCALLCLTGFAIAETPLFERPRTFRQHTIYLHQMVRALRAGDTERMEEICRQAVELMPRDATWNFNLACALSYRKDKSEALDTLERAIELGFRKPETIEKDNDLEQLRDEPRFKRLIAKARKLRDKPIPGVVALAPPTVIAGIPFEINPSNTVWNMDAGCFQSVFKLIRPSSQSGKDSENYNGPVSALIRSWLKEGGAAGNFGDLYMNRDRGHSKLGIEDFGEMTPVIYCEEAVEAEVDFHLPNTLFDYPLVGNCSMAMTRGVFWRSLPRVALTDQFSAVQQCRLYLANQLWVYPAHKDFGSEKGDLFPANAPFFTIARGSSFKDQPYARAYAAALAALAPDTKRMLVATKQIGAVMQMMLRYTSNRIKDPADYLSGAAHPVVFGSDDLNVTNLVKMAHGLRPDEVVPSANLQVIRENQSVAGVDYFDRLPETLMNTPVCVARIARGKVYAKTMTVQAAAPLKGEKEYSWVLLQGDPEKVKIKKLSQNGDKVEISVGWHGMYRSKKKEGAPVGLMSSRVDIACFVKGARYYSAPSVVSVYNIPSENRLYDEQNRIVSIDYSNPHKRYMDPALTIMKPWKDLYSRTEDGKLKGWYRKLGDRAERFTYAGHKVLESDKLNRPVLAAAVNYLPRSSGAAESPPVMTCVETPRKFRYTYENSEDMIGSYKPVE